MTTTTPVIFEKQLLINNIMQLCPDVLNIVKEYVFHERKIVYKNKKYKMIKQINTSHTGDSEDPYRLIFQTEEDDRLQFQTKFCSICGKYNYNINDNYVKYCYGILPYSDRLLCHHLIEDPFIV